MKLSKLFFLFLLFMLFVGNCYAHSGGTNASGCHTNHSNGDYHCHSGKAKESRTRLSEKIKELLSSDSNRAKELIKSRAVKAKKSENIRRDSNRKSGAGTIGILVLIAGWLILRFLFSNHKVNAKRNGSPPDNEDLNKNKHRKADGVGEAKQVLQPKITDLSTETEKHSGLERRSLKEKYTPDKKLKPTGSDNRHLLNKVSLAESNLCWHCGRENFHTELRTCKICESPKCVFCHSCSKECLDDEYIEKETYRRMQATQNNESSGTSQPFDKSLYCEIPVDLFYFADNEIAFVFDCNDGLMVFDDELGWGTVVHITARDVGYALYEIQYSSEKSKVDSSSFGKYLTKIRVKQECLEKYLEIIEKIEPCDRDDKVLSRKNKALKTKRLSKYVIDDAEEGTLYDMYVALDQHDNPPGTYSAEMDPHYD